MLAESLVTFYIMQVSNYIFVASWSDISWVPSYDQHSYFILELMLEFSEFLRESIPSSHSFNVQAYDLIVDSLNYVYSSVIWNYYCF